MWPSWRTSSAAGGIRRRRARRSRGRRPTCRKRSWGRRGRISGGGDSPPLPPHEADRGDSDPDRRRDVPDPEEKHPLDELAPEVGQPRVQLRVEPREVELVQVPEVGSVRSVHLVEPLHELVGELVTERFVELARQVRRDRHTSPLQRTGRTVTLRSAVAVINATHAQGASARTATASKSNVTRSATLTLPPSPPRKGRMPKSVCLTDNVPAARSVSARISTFRSTGTSRAAPCIVTSSSMWNPESVGATLRDANVISGKRSTWSTSVRMAAVTLRISSVSGGVSTSRLSAGTVIATCEEAGVPG